MHRKYAGWAMTAAVLIAAVAGAQQARPQTGLLVWQDPEVVARGAAIYAANCASCHGDELQGQPGWQVRGADGLMPAPPHDQTGHTWHHDDMTLFAITAYGSAAVAGPGYASAMAGFADLLSDDEIIAALSYIKSTWPAGLIELHDQVNARALQGQ